MARFIQRMGREEASADSSTMQIWMAASSSDQKTRSKGGGEGEESAEEGEGGQKLAKKGEELKEDMDSLLDEIDSVLEENAEEFVKNYVQRGGE
jgi:ubiquitin-like protein Pup